MSYVVCRVQKLNSVQLWKIPGKSWLVCEVISEWYYDYEGQSEYDKTIKEILHNRWSFFSHVKNVVSKSKVAKFSLFLLINEHSNLSINSKLFIFKTYIRRIITYTERAWTANISKSSWSKPKELQSTTLCQITELY